MIDNKKIVGGMIPKVNSCINALEKGVKRTHILDGRVDHALLFGNVHRPWNREYDIEGQLIEDRG